MATKKNNTPKDVEDAEVVDTGDADAPVVDLSAEDTVAEPETVVDDAPAEPKPDPVDDYEFAEPMTEAPKPEPVVEHEETAHTSLSARVLQGLALIAVGVALALWAAPRIAPMLPAGLKPVADFLMPGQTAAEEQIAALRAELDQKIAALESRPQNDIDQSTIDAAIGTFATGMEAELATIRDRLAATDGQDIEARLAALETRMEGTAAELGAVSDRLSKQITENGVALSEEAATKLSGYQAALEGLRAEVATLAAKNGALSQKVEEIANAAARRAEEAEQEASTRVTTSATRTLLTEIEAALDTGSPFALALQGLQDMTGQEPPAALAAVADTGTPSWTTLRNGFADHAHAALRADAKANAGSGVSGKLGAFLRTQVGTRSLERREGDDTDAILSRVEDDLVNRRLSAALVEAESLPDAPRAEIADWIDDLRALATARAAYDDLSRSFGATQ